MRSADILFVKTLAGLLIEDDEGYHFKYDPEYLQRVDSLPVSLSLPLQAEPYHSRILFPFLDGLIPEGWLLTIAEANWFLKYPSA